MSAREVSGSRVGDRFQRVFETISRATVLFKWSTPTTMAKSNHRSALMNAIASLAQLRPTGAVEDADPQETAEWCDALDSVVAVCGPARARYLLDVLAQCARRHGIGWTPKLSTAYVNTVAVTDQPAFPGDLAIEERLGAMMRWNALAMVVRANRAYGELGGHVASYASAADLFEVGLNHFFH